MPEREGRPPEIHLPYSELVQVYPSVEEWLADPEHRAAQVRDGARLASAEEKIELFGGLERVKENLADPIRRRRRSSIILQACRQGYMTGGEILHFGRLVGVDMHIAPMYMDIANLMRAEDEEEGSKLRGIEGVTYIVRVAAKPDTFRVTEGRKAFETTETGMRQLAKDVRRVESRGWLGVFQPKPTQE